MVRETAEERMAPKLAESMAKRVAARIAQLRAAYVNAPALSVPSFADVCPWIDDVLRHGKETLAEGVMMHVYGALTDILYEYSHVFHDQGTGRDNATARAVADEIRSRWESLAQALVFGSRHQQTVATLLNKNSPYGLESRAKTNTAEHRHIAISTTPYAPHDVSEAGESRYRVALNVRSLNPIASTASTGASVHGYSAPPRAPFGYYSTAPVYPRPEYAQHPAVLAVRDWQAAAAARAEELYVVEQTLVNLFASNPHASNYSVLQAIPGLRATLESLGFDSRGDHYLSVRGRDKYDMSDLRAIMPDFAERWVTARGVLAAAVLATQAQEDQDAQMRYTKPIPVGFPVKYDSLNHISPV